VGQEVDPHTLIAETTLQPEEPIMIAVTEAYGIPPTSLGDLLQIKEGDMVEVGQPLAALLADGNVYEMRSPGKGRIEQVSYLLGTISLRLEGDPNDNVRVVDAAEQLGEPAILASQFIQVRTGDFVRLGQIIATEPEREAVAFAPMQGVVTSVNGHLVTIERPFVRTQVKAFLTGRVVEVTPEWGAEIESEMEPLSGLYGLGGESSGELRLLVSAPQEVAAATAVSAQDSGKVLVAGALASADFLRACKKHNIAGVIAGGVHSMDLVQLTGAEIAPGMETELTLGLTLLLTEGMGEIPMEQSFFAALQSVAGKVVSMNGHTQIRAGVVRPVVYLPAGAHMPPTSTASDNTPIELGNRVRIIREPWFGVTGIVGAFTGPTVLPSGITTLTYQVATDSGEILEVARNNVERQGLV